jgi:hypothetical protein
MRRRTVLLGSAGLVAAAYGGTMVAGSLSPCVRFEVDNPVLGSAQRIGARLLASGFEPAPDAGDSLDRLRADLPARMHRDFAGNETVRCDGWVLSRSEAEFCVRCALATVTPV